MIYKIRVGYCRSYPIVPDEEFSYVSVGADSYVEASLTAAQLVGSNGGRNVTSTAPLEPAVVTLWPLFTAGLDP